MDTTRAALFAFIRDRMGYTDAIDSDTDLIKEQILDSFNVVELALFVEQQFGIELQNEDVNRDNFCSVARIEALIEKRRVPAD